MCVGIFVLKLRHVSKSYREAQARRAVLEDIDLDVARGEFVAVTGRSGTGKSTLLNLISGIDVPDSGAVILDGVDIAALGERERTCPDPDSELGKLMAYLQRVQR